PVAAMMLAAELLLFELKPRSLVPVAISSATAVFMRHYLIGGGALFPNFAHPGFIGVTGISLCIVTGLVAGVLAAALSSAIYIVEDTFAKLPVHWMWWPAIGGIFVGIGGMIYPSALSVGYDVIRQMMAGDITTKMIFGVLLVKSTMWAIALGSGTSGGVLAPLLMMGGALGGLEGLIFPNFGPGFWPLLAMAALLGGTMQVPITAVIFALELTHNVDLLMPLLVTSIVAYGVTVLIMHRSILTEKISRRGYHLSREYSVDPLEIIFTREVMRTDIVALRPDLPVSQVQMNTARPVDRKGPSQGLYPVINSNDELVGVVTRTDLAAIENAPQNGHEPLVQEIAQPNPVVAHPDEPLRIVAYRMAATGLTRLPVVDRSNHAHLVGMIAFGDLLYARERVLNEERQRERVLRLRFFNRGKPTPPTPPIAPAVETPPELESSPTTATEERLPAGSSSLK
ncbi:MAG TPA: chloride channel protein, partial [Thermomicrobiales bacterium]|nr:chloride channel protein [Thermomicrobiales bacterium]